MTEKQLADKIVQEMVEAGLSYDQMIKI